MLYETEKNRKVKTFVGISKQFLKKIKHILLISYFAMLSHIFVRLKRQKQLYVKRHPFLNVFICDDLHPTALIY